MKISCFTNSLDSRKDIRERYMYIYIYISGISIDVNLIY